MTGPEKLLSELKRRRVFQVLAFYIVAAWVTIQVADLAFESWNIPTQAVRFVWIAALLGLPLALLLGWRYDISWQGIVRTQSAEPHAPDDVALNKVDFFLLGFVALLAVIITIGAMKQVRQSGVNSTSSRPSNPEQQEFPDKSLAVLPFTNMSDDASNEYFSDGLSEELLNRLNRIEDLKVSARTSSFSYKNKDIDIVSIANQLRVKHVLEGSVRKAGKQIRVTASLVNAQSGFELWSQTFELLLEDVFEVQDQISAAVVEALKLSLLESPARPVVTENLQAYELYLEGRFELHRRNADSIRRSIQLFEQAVSLDSGFAPAYLELATATFILPQFAPTDDSLSVESAKSLARKAFSLDPTLGKAIAIEALISHGEHDWSLARREFERALEISPHESIIHLWYASLLASVGQTRQALGEALLSYELDPQSGLITGWLCALYSAIDDTEMALKYCVIALKHDFPYARLLYGMLQIDLNEFDQAYLILEAFSKDYGVNEQWVSPFVTAITDSSKKSIGIEALALLESEMGRRWDIIGMFVRLAALDEAFGSASKTMTQSYTMNAIWTPAMRQFRQDPRFPSLLNEMGLTDYWQEYGRPDLCQKSEESLYCE